jgi:hypothetical protein
MQAVFGGIAFAVLFAAWVVVPTVVRKRHDVKAEEKGDK